MATPAPYEIPGFSFSLTAASDLSGSQYRFCKCDANGQADAPSAGGLVVGVRQNKAASGRAVTVMADGISLVEAGSGGVTGGAKVTTDNAGRCVAAATGNITHGIALTAAASGEFAAVLILLSPDSVSA